VAIAERINCMECGGVAFLAQPIGPDDVFEPGDSVVYLCGECAQRWDVVVDEDDLIEDEDLVDD
jgi:DNA-directed RNA polymerase subunit RPC12/RpoP